MTIRTGGPFPTIKPNPGPSPGLGWFRDKRYAYLNSGGRDCERNDVGRLEARQ